VNAMYFSYNEAVKNDDETGGFRMKFKLLGVCMVLLAVFLVSACGKGGGTEASGSAPSGETKEFTINAKNFEFDVKEMKVKKGDTVKVTLVNAEGNHAVKINGYNKDVQANKTITFVADKTGQFNYICSIFCGTGHDKMVGKLIVE
jgi:cytochrome c oxidase subunit 2